MPQRILGLDLGASAVKAVLLESAFRGFAVLGTATVPVPGGDGAALQERQMEALRSLLGSMGWQFDAAVVAFPGSAAASHVVALPFTDPRRIEQAVPFEVESQIPFDLPEVSWDWQPLGTRGGRTELYVGVVRREELAALLAALAQVGVDPRVVVPAAPVYEALFGAGVLAGEAAAEGTAGAQVLLDVGHERSNVCVVAGGRCEAARTFGVGLHHVVRSVASDLGASPDEARSMLESRVGSDPQVLGAVRRGLVPLVRELRATLKAWEARGTERPGRRLVLAGAAARLGWLPEVLAPEVGVPVEAAAFEGPAAAVPPGEAPSLALALALALRGHLGGRVSRLNLRRGALAYTRDFEHLRGRVARLAAYAGLVLLLALLSAGVKIFALSRQEALLDKALCDATQKLVGKCYDNFETAEAVLKGRGTPSAAVPRSSAADVLVELSLHAPPPDVAMRLDRIEITREKVHLVGTTDAAENVDKIVGGLRGSRCFAETRSGGARRRASDGKFEFSVDADVACDGAPAAGGRG